MIPISILWPDVCDALLLWDLSRLASAQLWQTFLTNLMLCCFNITWRRLLKLSWLRPCWYTVCFQDLLTKFRWGARGWTTQDSGVTGVCLESFPYKVRLAKASLEIFSQTLPSLPLVYHEHLSLYFPPQGGEDNIDILFKILSADEVWVYSLGWSWVLALEICVSMTHYTFLNLEQADLLLKIASECLFAFQNTLFGIIFLIWKSEQFNHASEFQDSETWERRITSLRAALAT